MNNPSKIVIVGSGFGGIYTIKYLDAFARSDRRLFKVTMISKRDYFLFTPLLHEVATGSVNRSNIVQPVRQILRSCMSELLEDEVLGVDTQKQLVKTKLAEVPYDFLVIAAGAKTNYYNFPENLVFGLKDLEDAARLKNHLISQFELASREADKNKIPEMLTFVVVGGGATGVELAAEIDEFCRKNLLDFFPSLHDSSIAVYLVQNTDRLMPQFDLRLSKRAESILRKKSQVRLIFNSKVSQITAEGAILDSGKVLLSRTVVLSAGIKPEQIGFLPAVETSPPGRIPVNEYLQLPTVPNVYIIGDMAYVSQNGIVVAQTAQAAEAEAKIATFNILASIQHQPLKVFNYKERGQLVSLGRWQAVAKIYWFHFSGHFAWWVWRTIYASKLLGWANRLRVVLDWTIDIFYPRDISKL